MSWRETLRKAGFRVTEVPYVLGEVNPEFVFEDTETTRSMVDATLGLPLAPPRVKP